MADDPEEFLCVRDHIYHALADLYDMSRLDGHDELDEKWRLPPAAVQVRLMLILHMLYGDEPEQADRLVRSMIDDA